MSEKFCLSNKINQDMRLRGIVTIEDVKEFIQQSHSKRIRVEILGSGWQWVIMENDLIELAGEVSR